MPFYLETLCERSCYLAGWFCDVDDEKLIDGKIYNAKDIGFFDWMKCHPNVIKVDKTRLRAVLYGKKEEV